MPPTQRRHSLDKLFLLNFINYTGFVWHLCHLTMIRVHVVDILFMFVYRKMFPSNINTTEFNGKRLPIFKLQNIASTKIHSNFAVIFSHIHIHTLTQHTPKIINATTFNQIPVESQFPTMRAGIVLIRLQND